MKKLIYVKITGQGINERFEAVSHEVKGYPAGTYHCFELINGTELYFNDFGVRSIVISDRKELLD